MSLPLSHAGLEVYFFQVQLELLGHKERVYVNFGEIYVNKGVRLRRRTLPISSLSLLMKETLFFTDRSSLLW